jgi:hypothetical protein
MVQGHELAQIKSKVLLSRNRYFGNSVEVLPQVVNEI